MITVSLVALSGLGLGACVSSMAYTSKVEAAYPAEGRQIDVGGHDVHVLERGPGTAPVVLMIHGASANAREFTGTLAPRLETDMRVLMADRPGHGYSERFDGAETLAAQARQMAGLLDQLAPDQKAVIVGHSFGGAVALRIALDRPDLVSGLVLLAPVTHDWGEGSGTAWYNSIAANPVFGPVFSQFVPIIGPSQMKDGISSVFAPAPTPQGYYQNSGLGLLLRPPNFRANAQDMTRLKDELAQQSARYGDLSVPITVFSGSKDTVLSPKLHAVRLKKQVPVEMVILPDEGHMPHHGEGSAVAGAIRRLAFGRQTR
ncbi:hydrolase, alpha/beta fold family [Hyphomonas neptunium ATCC 15444]|uniref:Hydrolase, alpha/beta fold family n=2 Tax=Hyphomonas TaxID=85 RepID=Q0BWW7_HYPNA|nr:MULTISPECIES: alpha/beta hydrolase [Hyphomonas]ABI77493.1 hydrolase, alpha/beta fold family [Hyphomonas neptunium ATCC 15444]KCZ91975.1 alpha/beta fold family hydrolase [Hyphomonas hirschiana VP5]